MVQSLLNIKEENFQPFTCCADIELLKSQISAQRGKKLLNYGMGHEKAIKKNDIRKK